MVTVVIIGILGAVAVPAYQDYTIRSQVIEGLSLASGAKTQVAEYYSNHGVFPESSEELGYNEATGSIISKTEIHEDGEIRTIFGEGANKDAQGKTLSLFPWPTASENLKWDCEGTLEEKHMPTGCQEQVEPVVTTETRAGSNCSSGYTGEIIESRTVTTPSRCSPTYGEWAVSSNTCKAPTVINTTYESKAMSVSELRALGWTSCYYSTVRFRRTVTHYSNGTTTYGGWSHYSGSCV